MRQQIRPRITQAAQKGQAAVEFALVSVVLLSILFGILEVGRLVFVNAEVGNAAREGVQYAALHAFDTNLDTDLASFVKSKLVGLDTSNVTITKCFVNNADDGCNPTACPFCRVKVTVTYRWSTAVPLLGLGTIPLQGDSMKLIEVNN